MSLQSGLMASQVVPVSVNQLLTARPVSVEAPSLAAGVLGPGGGGLCYNSLSVQGLGTTVVVSTSGEGSRRKGGRGEGGRCNRGRSSTGADIVQLQCCVAQYQAW